MECTDIISTTGTVCGWVGGGGGMPSEVWGGGGGACCVVCDVCTCVDLHRHCVHAIMVPSTQIWVREEGTAEMCLEVRKKYFEEKKIVLFDFRRT